MKRISIAHISHGIIPTGGFLHEQFLQKKLADYFSTHKGSAETEKIRAHRFFKGISQLRLLAWSFVKANADVNIVVARTALSAIFRNFFSSSKVLILLHYFDERDGKGSLLKWYYRVLFFVLKHVHLRNVALVAVAPFWVAYFKNKTGNHIPVFHFPNFFDIDKYQSFVTSEKNKRVHLGQYSFKNDKNIFKLARELTSKGFRCYFSTMIKEEEGKFDGYEVRYEDHKTYLETMAGSEYTLAYMAINEGWNRVAHESVLMGTTVIGNDAGGLGDLIRESGSLPAADHEQFKSYIINHQHAKPSQVFIDKYDLKQADHYLKPIVDWLF